MEQDMQLASTSEREFFADEVWIVHGPFEFVIDFKKTYPVIDLGRQRLIAKHQPIILNPYIAKDFLNVLTKNIKKYEEKYGEIKKPESFKKAEELTKEQKKKGTKDKASTPTYFG